MRPRTVALIAVCFAAAVVPARAQDNPAALFAKKKDAVFTVDTPKSSGSGFILDGRLLVTCWHVVKDTPSSVSLREAKGVRLEHLVHDASRDVAIYKLGAARSSSLALAPKSPAIGTRVYIIGTPLGALQRSLSDGLVSSFRSLEGQNLMQMTAPISPGCSGGPVLNRSGQVVGMVASTIEEGQANNFAITLESIRAVLSTTNPGKVRSSGSTRSSNSKSSRKLGPILSCYITAPTMTYQGPSRSTPLFMMRGKRLTQGRKTSDPNWVALPLTSGTTVYIEADQVVLFKPNSKDAAKYKDPYSVEVPSEFKKLLAETESSDPARAAKAADKLNKLGSKALIYLMALNEYEFDSTTAIKITLLGRQMLPVLKDFLRLGNSNQYEALAYALSSVSEAYFGAVKELSEPRPDTETQQAYDSRMKYVQEQIDKLGWVTDELLVAEFDRLFQYRQSTLFALDLVRIQGLDSFRGTIQELLASDDPAIKMAAFNALATLAEAEDEPYLRSALKAAEQDYGLFGSYLNILGSSESEVAFKLLLDQVDSESFYVRSIVAPYLAQSKRQEALARLEPLLSDEYETVRCSALKALCAIDGARYLGTAKTMANDSSATVRAAAAEALGVTGRAAAVPPLRELLSDMSKEVVFAAMRALGVLGTDSAADALIEMLKSTDPDIRRMAREALRSMGKEPPPRL